MKQVIPYLSGAMMALLLLVFMAADSDLAEAASKKRRTAGGGGCQTLSAASLHAKASGYNATIHSAANQYGVSPSLVKAVITVESCFRSKARGSLGEKGLMQLMPGTARRFDIRNGYNATQNIHGGARYLGYLLKRYDGNVQRAVAAYNAGEGRIKRSGRIPNKGYVSKVMKAYGKFTTKGVGGTLLTSSTVQPEARLSLAEYKASVINSRREQEKTVKTASPRKAVVQKASLQQSRPVVQKAKWKAPPKTASKPLVKTKATTPPTGLPWADLGVHYRVKPGDTVYEVMRQTGAPVKSIIGMNGLKAPYGIQAGQTLRVR